jgi:hypothetical protein
MKWKTDLYVLNFSIIRESEASLTLQPTLSQKKPFAEEANCFTSLTDAAFKRNTWPYTSMIRLGASYQNEHQIYKSRNNYVTLCKSRDSSVGIALGYGLDNRGSRIRFPAGAGNFSLRHVQNGSRTHPASYPMGTRGSFPGGKAAGSWSWPLTSI